MVGVIASFSFLLTCMLYATLSKPLWMRSNTSGIDFNTNSYQGASFQSVVLFTTCLISSASQAAVQPHYLPRISNCESASPAENCCEELV